MKMMNIRILYCCLLLALAVAASSAQTKTTVSGTCSKPDAQSIPAGDKPDHVFIIAQGKCTTTKGEIAGVMSKDGTFSEHDDATPSHMRGWGVYTENYANGDKVFYNYQLSVATKDGAVQSGHNTYQATGGTGKMKGVKGKGTCTYTPGTDGGLNFSCHGEYTLAGGAMAAK
ncbi:MAG: hypothetical protein ACRD2U_09285 [Terriglobales bacterium]